MAFQVETRDIYQGASNLETLRGIGERHQHAKIQVGRKSVTVDAQTALMLTTIHDSLGVDNKVKFVAMLAHSTGTFHQIIGFGWKHVTVM